MGILQDIFGGTTSSTVNTPIVGGGTQGQFFQGLFGTGLGSNDQGYGVLNGVPAYGGPLSYDINQTMLPSVYGGWSPTTAGSNFAGGMLQNGFGLNNSQFASPASYYQQFGGTGVPTQNMSLISQYGGYGAPANMMSNIAQFGGAGGAPTTGMGQLMTGGATAGLLPNYQAILANGGIGGIPTNSQFNLMNSGTTGGPAGQGLTSMAGTGVAGTWGNPLMATAYGAGSPAAGFLSNTAQASNIQPLQNIIGAGGYATNTVPAWNAMVQAQQRNIAEGQAGLAEQFNSSDNRFSTAYGTATADYQNQARANQNAMLGQMVNTSNEEAQNRVLQAASTLGGLSTTAAGQLSGQTYGAGNMLAGLGSGATSALNQNSLLGAGNLFSNQNAGLNTLNANNLFGLGQTFGAQNNAVGNMFGASNAATTGMYNAQNAMLPQFMNYDLASQNLGLNTATGLNNMLMGNLGVGNTLGTGQYNIGQGGINNQYANWWQSLPQNNPLLPYMFGAATGYTGNTQSSGTSGLLGGLGSILGGLGGIAGGGGFGTLFSDERLKEEIEKVGELRDLNIYSYRFKGLPEKQLGFIAQEVYERYPEAAIPGSDSAPWMIKPGVLLEALVRTN